MLSFHEAHFSQLATAHFGSHFLQPGDPTTALANKLSTAEAEVEHYDEEEYYEEEEEYYEEEDDGLGYYPDGVKRTLTDEQIAIFRHSELEALRRAKEAEDLRMSKKRSAETASPAPLETAAAEDGEIPDGDDGNVSEEGEIDGPAPKKRKKSRRKKARTRADGVVIDLRKRTWDVVETGLETLDYEEEEGQRRIQGGRPMQRRRVSYDD